MVIYKDVKLKITPEQWMAFTVPQGVTIVWDKYNFKEKTVVGRFTVSENHLNPDNRKNEEFLNIMIERLGNYVVKENATHESLKDVRFGEFSSTWMGHPYTKDLPSSTDIHIAKSHNTDIITKQELQDINYGIKYDSYRNPTLKKYRDERLKPKEKGDGYEVYVAVLEEIPK